MIDNIPQSLKDFGAFCVWGYWMKEGKQTKIPYNPISRAKAKANDPTTFSSFEVAKELKNKYPTEYYGLGVGLFGDMVGIDIDHCVDEEGNLSDIALDIVSMINSYTEKSPSGTGVHIYCFAPGIEYDTDRFYIKNSKLNIEIYVAGKTNRYLTVTGDAINTEDVNERSNEIMELAEKYMLRQVPKSVCSDSLEREQANDAELLDDAEIINKMLSSSRGDVIAKLWSGDYEDYPSQSEADLALCNHLAFWTRKNPDQMDRLFRASGLYRGDKWNRKQSGTTYGAITISKAVDGCTSVWTPGYKPILYNNVEAALDFLRSVDAAHEPRYSYDDIGAGYLLADYTRPFARPIAKSKSWMVYDGIHWSDKDGESVVEESAKDISRALSMYATELKDNKMKELLEWAGKWTQHQKRKQFIQEATSVYPVSRSDFDTNPYLLNLNNGTLNLKSLELQEHNPDDLLTHIAPVDYAPGVQCTRWLSFVDEIMIPGESECVVGNAEEISKKKAEFLQRYLGYCLCGDTREEAFIIMYGPTSRNGKSVCVEAVKAILGSYSRAVNAETLMQAKHRDSSGPSEDVARLAGIRMACVGEISQGAHMDAARVKLLTGGDSVNARFLGENSFDFVPQFKLLLHTNHLPECNDMSVFDSGRVLVLPFSRHFEEHEQDKNLKRLFREPENQSGILNWMIQGYQNYLDSGLEVPDIVRDATKKYRMDNDKVCRFIEEALCTDDKGKTTTAYVYDVYKAWCKTNGQWPESNRSFLNKLEQTGIQIIRSRPYSGANPTTMIMGYSVSGDLIPGAVV